MWLPALSPGPALVKELPLETSFDFTPFSSPLGFHSLECLGFSPEGLPLREILCPREMGAHLAGPQQNEPHSSVWQALWAIPKTEPLGRRERRHAGLCGKPSSWKGAPLWEKGGEVYLKARMSFCLSRNSRIILVALDHQHCFVVTEI